MLGVTSNRAALEKINTLNTGARSTSGSSIGGGAGGGFQVPQSLGGGATPEQIIQLVNEINQGAQQDANAGRIPGGADLENLSSANISSALSGQLDPSVLQLLGQQSAERGIRTGSPGGPSTNAQYLRSLGLTSLDLMGQGQNWLSQATSRNPAAPIYNAGNMVITPEQQAQIDLENRRLQEMIRSNQAQEAIARMRGNGGSFGGGGGGMPRSSARGQPATTGYGGPSLFLPQQTGNTTVGEGTFSTNWDNELFDWGSGTGVLYQEPPSTPSWVMPQTSFNDGTPDLGNITDGSLWGSIGYGATSNPISTGWDDFFDIGSIGSNSLYDYDWF